MSALQIFAGLFAALIHDFAHPGTTNAHEIKMDSPLALRYHDASVLESHSLFMAFTTLLEPQYNFIAAWDRKMYMGFRALIVKLVLMTDLSKHFEFITVLNAAAEASLCADAPTPPDASLVLTVAIKGADLGHSLKPQALHYNWSLWVTEEFFLLGDTERKAGVPISTFCDRDKDTDLAKSQHGFLQFVCRPFYTAVQRVLPDVAAAANVERLDANLNFWKDCACTSTM